MTRAIRAWLIALAAGLIAAVVAVVIAVHVHPGSPDTRPAGDRVRAAAAALKRDHFYAAPEVREQFTDAQYTALVNAAKSTPTPVYVVFWGDVGYDAGYLGDLEACKQLTHLIGRKGYYGIVTQGGYGSEQEAVGYNEPFIDGDIAQGRPADGMMRYIKALGDAPREKPRSFDYWGGPGGGIAAGALFTVPAFFVLMLLVKIASLFRRKP